ncbi:MAG: hypothetical protein AB1758_11225 [Candidatus Eremiobacterota bacterium]
MSPHTLGTAYEGEIRVRLEGQRTVGEPLLDAMFARMSSGASPSDDPDLKALAEEVVRTYESRPVDMASWADTLARSSSLLND